MKHIKIFVLLVITVGVCALLGSAIGAAIGHRGLFVGGFLGGSLGCGAAAWIGGRLRWVPTAAIKATGLGALLGFVLGATIALNTLHSPVGPILSTLFIGVGGLLGGRLAGRQP